MVGTNHGEDGSEDADLLGCRGDLVVPFVVGGEEVEHELEGLLALCASSSLHGLQLTIRFITAYCWPRQ